MKNEVKYFILRHAEVDENGINLSQDGKKQANDITVKIKKIIGDGNKNISIWSSGFTRSDQTAKIVSEGLGLSGQFEQHEELFSPSEDYLIKESFACLKSELEKFDGSVLIMISHLDTVKNFPEYLGLIHHENHISCMNGFFIHNGKCEEFHN